MSNRFWSAALAFGLASATPALAQAPAAFDAFLGGLLDGCAVRGDFRAYAEAVQDRAQGRARGAAAAPAGLAGALGAPRVADKGEYTAVEIDAKGAFRGLALGRLNFSFGKENGIFVIELVFAEPADKVRKALGAATRASRAKMRREFATDATTELVFKGGKSTLVCNLSN